MDHSARERLNSLRAFLEVDPRNPELLSDAARSALDAGEYEFAAQCFSTLDKIEPLEGENANLAGIAAMRSGSQEMAQRWFFRALEIAPYDHATRFNLAWSHALQGDFESSADFLDDEVVSALPQAAMLDMQIAHELGRFEDAEAKMHSYLNQHPNYQPLHAAASVLAMDVNRPDLARASALKGGAHPDALTTLASLDLAEHNIEAAKMHFEEALKSGRMNPRAEIGLGLVALASGDHLEAAHTIDKGAEQFGEHLGSWIAAGWAHLLTGDVNTAKLRFERAMEVDDKFGEAHGSLAIIDLLQGDTKSALRKAEVAGRLDPASFSAALAKVLLAEASGEPERARAILEHAMSTPILPDGRTLKQALAMSMTGRPS